MAKINIPVKSEKIITYEGATAQRITIEAQLYRTVCSCLLWEDTFYEDGQSIVARIAEYIPKVAKERVAALAIKARKEFKLRHIPLLIVREMAQHKSHRGLVAETLATVIQRPDELTEFLAIYWKDGRTALSAQVKKGLASAFRKFDEYQLAKYNRADKIKLRDVLFLCHAKPKDEAQDALWKRLIDNKLKTPETWEVSLSAAAVKTKEEKRDCWIRLLGEGKLGAMALLRNLRNMQESGVKKDIIEKALIDINPKRVLPFRFITAAKYVPTIESAIEVAMLKCLKEYPKLNGKTTLVIDSSYSMVGSKISKRSEIDRFDAACALAILAREMCEDVEIIAFSNGAQVVPARHGFALRDAIDKAVDHCGTYTDVAINVANKNGYDRIIVFTDEQSYTSTPDPLTQNAYFVNVAVYKNGIGYGKWIHIDGFSESIFDYIRESEKL